MKLNSFFIILFLLISATSCSQKGRPKQSQKEIIEKVDTNKDSIDWSNLKTKAYHYKTNGIDIAVFPKEYNEFLPENRFTPTLSEIDKAEKALQTKLHIINKGRDNQSSSPIIDQNLKNYKRQYFGCIDENGKKYLLINCFWSMREDTNGWLEGMVIVFDGGSYYWEIKYYIDEDELKDLSVNGYA